MEAEVIDVVAVLSGIVALMVLAALVAKWIRDGADAMLDVAVPLFLVGMMLCCLGTCSGLGVALVRLVWLAGG